jgi:putative heme-binding domain-containing protein
MPGPALTPAEAIKRMKVPDGFTVELVASEPDIVNPVAMTFDERGRIWITESLEYPRQSAGKGRDRIKVLESTKGDGRYDKITVFAEGLNIPSGIAVGHGGVWVANSPDILFLKDTDGDGKADKTEVVVTGFGRTDTHELPNSLTWGPDGWLYGLNGVFNYSHVKQNGKEWRFTCAMFRIHPRTREFQLFCEGTSNPWGIAIDREGSAFVSACVIDHLWHLTETGYYFRQGGPYPPFTWILPSIVRHRHQKAAYCGLHYFDSDAYPKEYRERLYMGNIHGGCVNVDVLSREDSTYTAKTAPDFLTANDQWFMPVSQKTGPDGCLYILDWYDRYHCYQDANRDPAGIDRKHGRLYRIRYKNTPPAGKFDLAKESDDQLVKRLSSPNVYFRDQAQRMLCERNTAAVRDKLQKLVLDDKAPRKARMHGLWALVGCGPLDRDFHKKLLAHDDPGFRAWGVRAAGNAGKVDAVVRKKVAEMVKDKSPDVRLQVAIAARKIDGLKPLPLLVECLARSADDRLIPAIVWQNVQPLLEKQGDDFLRSYARANVKRTEHTALFQRLLVNRMLARKMDAVQILALFRVFSQGKGDHEGARAVLAGVAGKLQTGEIAADAVPALRERFLPVLRKVQDGSLATDATLLAATLKDREGLASARKLFAREKDEKVRLAALYALIAGGDGEALALAVPALEDARAGSADFRARVLAALGRLEDPKVAKRLLAGYARMQPEFRPKVIDLLTQRDAWGNQLVEAVAAKKVPAGDVNVNGIRRLLRSKDPAVAKQAKATWGSVREERNPEREKMVRDMTAYLRKTRGDAKAGALVFKRVCAQCHKIHGEGQEVGPDLTSNGRGSWNQMISNVFDPSLVIGPSYQAVTVVTKKGRTLTGLLVEDSKQRVVLKMEGGKTETVARSAVEAVSVSKVSLMPENLEKQMTKKEIADLFAFLSLDRPPGDPKAKPIPGTPR